MEEVKTITTEESVAVKVEAKPVIASSQDTGKREWKPRRPDGARSTDRPGSRPSSGKPGEKAGPRGGRGGARGARPPREKPEFETKTVSVRRVTRVVSGGRRFSLSIAVIIGDRNGRVGLGTAKALDTQVAIEKASKDAKKHLMTIKLDKNKKIMMPSEAKYNASEVKLMPNDGKGLIAGSSARTVLTLAGIQNITAKYNSGSKNKLNNARAVMKALEKLSVK